MKADDLAAPDTADVTPTARLCASPPIGPAALTRRVNLHQQDRARLRWLAHSQPATAAPRPFDLDACLSQARSMLAVDAYEMDAREIPAALSKQEAWFWLRCLELWPHADGTSQEGWARLEQTLRTALAAGVPADPEARAWAGDTDQRPVLIYRDAPHLLLPFFTAAEIAGLIVRKHSVGSGPGVVMTTRSEPRHITGFTRLIVPALDERERADLAAELERQYETWMSPPVASSRSDVRAHLFLMLLCAVGGGRHLTQHLAAQPDGSWGRAWLRCALGYLELLAALDQPEAFAQQARRLGCLLQVPSDVRLWLAATGWRQLDAVTDAVIRARGRDEAAALARVAAAVEAPEAAPMMLAILGRSRAPGVARQWLLRHPLHTAIGLTPVAMAGGPLAEGACAQLLGLRRAGHLAALSAARAHLGTQEASWLQREILEGGDPQAPAMSAAQLPEPLRAALDALTPADPGEWLSLHALPPILVEGRSLGGDAVLRVLRALTQKPTAARAAGGRVLFGQLRSHADPDSLDRFAWALFEQWQHAGAPPRDRWAMGAIGHLGGALCVRRLPALLRAWPREGQHGRAVFGLACLGRIGSTAALMALDEMIKRPGYKSLKPRAEKVMRDVGEARGQSIEELADQIVPRCELSPEGTRVFDLGPRKLRFELTPRPVLRDARGRTRVELPRQAPTDDPQKARAAADDWKRLKKALREVLREQTARLEDAMVSGRSWTPAQLQTLFLPHPVMSPLLRGLVLAVCDGPGRVTQTLRVAEDRSFMDEEDRPLTLAPEARVRVAHPAHLDERLKAAWGQILSDYLIAPPFAQLTREIHRPGPQELAATEITRFRDTEVSGRLLYDTLEASRWQCGPARHETPGSKAGRYVQHSKHFLHARVRAFIRYSGFHVGYRGRPHVTPLQSLKALYFVPGTADPEQPESRLQVRDVDPAVVSEVLRLAQGLTAPG